MRLSPQIRQKMERNLASRCQELSARVKDKLLDATLSLLNLGGSIALLLWGVHMVQSGVQRAFGPDLRRFLAKTLDNRIKAAVAGLGVTTILQSSTATGLMVASFASAGFVALIPALAAMLGANVGTTLIVQALSFDVSRASPLLLLAGVVMFRAGSARTRDIGRVAIGLRLMLIALSTLLEIITPYEDVPSLRILMGGIATDRLISIVFGALLAWAAHSSVAVALLVMSFAEKGVVPLNAALALIIGANIGTALNPLLEGARGGDARDAGLQSETSSPVLPVRRSRRRSCPSSASISCRSSRISRAQLRTSIPRSTS
jgi:phosphate:Na+ symporter